jgi:hypothetical protein
MTDWPTADMSLICPTCSTLNRTDAHFCATCGTPFGGDTLEAPAPGPAAAPDAADAHWSAKVEAFFNDEAPPAGVAAADTADGVDTTPDTTLACPTCGNHNDVAAPFCGSCGAELHAIGAAADGPPVGELLGPHALRIPLRGVMSIGRDPRNSIAVRDASISRVHSRIDCRSGLVLLSDLQSTNGTWLNGQRIEHEELSDGDRILVGRTEFVFRSLQRSPRPAEARPTTSSAALGSVEDWLAPEASDAEAFPGAATAPVYDDPWSAPAPHAADPWTSPHPLPTNAPTSAPTGPPTGPPSQVDAAWAALGVPVSPTAPSSGSSSGSSSGPSFGPDPADGADPPAD